MKAGVIVFPGSNCDRDTAVALKAASGSEPAMIWHGESALPALDLIVVPGGFAYGDYLRAGAMAAHSPIMRAVKDAAEKGTPVLGICNGFQVLTEAHLLPGALMRNQGLHFVCRDVHLKVEHVAKPFTQGYRQGQVVRIPVAHHDGCYFADPETIRRLEDEGRVAFRYVDETGTATAAANPNGSLNNIAGIVNERGNVLGLMPHPERLADIALGGTDGQPLFASLVEALA